MNILTMEELTSLEMSATDDCGGNRLAEPQLLPAEVNGLSSHLWAGIGVLRVLVVDVEQDATNGLVENLRHWGHKVVRTSYARSAVSAASRHRPDVVLIDLDMLLVNGCQLASQLRITVVEKECLIIALTHWADEERRRQCREIGIDLVLVKPIDTDVLETLLLLECVQVCRTHVERSAYPAGPLALQADN